ncbi:MAG TPA: class II fructose-bisphosphate aldolase [Atopobiaceae bacterium]|nr:class II fructose-bisphosphate aldolase [Atopobiaceae bacterium]
MLVNMNELLSVAARGHFAVPAFNISSYAMFNGIMDISEQKSAPVIIEIHPNELKHIGSDAVAGMVKRAGISTVPVAIHLDHGSSLSDVMAAIRAGFTSVMIDASALPFEENAALAKRVVEAAHAAISYTTCYDDADPRRAEVPDGDDWHYVPSAFNRYVSVEAELGNIGVTDADKAFGQVIHYTQPAEAVEFIKSTGIDTLAIAIGTCHGLYPEGYVPELKLDLLRAIKAAIADAGLTCYLVLHGGSNNPDDEIAEAARSGICKINISSDIKVAYYAKMREVLENKGLREPNEIEPPCIAAMQEVAAQKIDLFGAAGTAKRYV